MKKQHGFTLVELLIVIMIIGILATMAVPQYNKMVEKAKWSEAVTTLGVIKKACEMYYMEKGYYPNKTGYATYFNGANGNIAIQSAKGYLDIEISEPKSGGRYVYGLVAADYLPSGQLAFGFQDKDNSGGNTGEPTIDIRQDGKLISSGGAPNF